MHYNFLVLGKQKFSWKHTKFSKEDRCEILLYWPLIILLTWTIQNFQRKVVRVSYTCPPADIGDAVLCLSEGVSHQVVGSLLHINVHPLRVSAHPQGQLLAVPETPLLENGQGSLCLVHHPNDTIQHLKHNIECIKTQT